MSNLDIVAAEIEDADEKTSLLKALVDGVSSLSMLAKGRYGDEDHGHDEDEADEDEGDEPSDTDPGDMEAKRARMADDEPDYVGADDMGKAVDVTSFLVETSNAIRDVRDMAKSSASGADLAELHELMDTRIGRLEKAVATLARAIKPMGKGVALLIKAADNPTSKAEAARASVARVAGNTVVHPRFGQVTAQGAADLRKASPADLTKALDAMNKGVIGDAAFRRFKLTGAFSDDAHEHAATAAKVAAV